MFSNEAQMEAPGYSSSICSDIFNVCFVLLNIVIPSEL